MRTTNYTSWVLVAVMDVDQRVTGHAWCQEQVGKDNFRNMTYRTAKSKLEYGSAFLFRHEQDAVAFCLAFDHE